MNEDHILDNVVKLWRRADELANSADVLEVEAKSLRKRAEDGYEAAEDLWRPLISDHPEWLDDLIMEHDPRIRVPGE